jgi:hypothetical protein
VEANTLFLKTLEDIQSRLSETDLYEILLIAGLLRKLLLDDHPLVDQVNRIHRLKLEFEIAIPENKPEEGDQNSVWSVQDGLDPDTAIPGKKRQILSRDQFLQTAVAMIYGPSYSIRDVIQFEANIAGGVHAGAPRTEKEQALNALGQSFGIGGYEPPLRQLLAIARVSLKALAPLRDAVAAA